MKKTYLFHPFLFTFYAVMAPLAHNFSNVGLSAVRVLVYALFSAVLLVNVIRLFIKHREQAGLLSTGLLVLFFSYGHLVGFLPVSRVVGIFRDFALLMLWVVMFGLWTYWVLKKLEDFITVSNFLNIVTFVLILFPIQSIFTYTQRTSKLDAIVLEYQRQFLQEAGLGDLSSVSARSGEPLPDIYYIIVDGYTRQDVLQELYGYDNTEFIQFLEKKDFYIARESRSNYTDTVYSLSSSLNMTQINTVLEILPQANGAETQEVLKDALAVLIKHNRLRSFLREQGYSMVYFDSGYKRIRIENADFFEKAPDVGEFNSQAAFELMLMDTTLGKLYLRMRGKSFVPLQSLFDDHRKRVLYTFDNISKYAGQDGNYFIFAHIISPHAPYVFGPNGEERRMVDPFTLLDNSTGESWSPDMYRDQVVFINKLLTKAVEQILAQSDPDPIIVIQADHSSRAYNQLNPKVDLKMKLLLPILNAYYMPGVDEASFLYPGITPVNSFRIILNHYFDTQLDLLDDTSYIFEENQGTWEFVNACQTYQACP